MTAILRVGLAALTVSAYLAGAGLPTTPMLGMDCHPECGECVVECCCGPTTLAVPPAGIGSPSERPRLLPLATFACLTPRGDSRLPGTPPRGPPA